MAKPNGEDVDAVERALEQLLRLSSSRKVHARQAAAAGVVVSQPGLALLTRIQEEGPLPLGTLARHAHMDAAATGRQVRQLERDGLVARVASPDDRRVTLVRVTPKGADVRRRIAMVRGRHMDDVLTGWSATDRKVLGRLLTRLVDDLRAMKYRDDGEEDDTR